MTTGNDAAAQTAPRELVITRILNAPRELVFKAWTTPEHLAKWWGPDGFTTPFCELDVRPGGALRIDMAGPDGLSYPTRGTYEEIVTPERLVFITTAFDDAAGAPALEVRNVVTFVEYGPRQTQLTLRATVLRAAPEAAGPLAGMKQGWTESLDRLAEMIVQL